MLEFYHFIELEMNPNVQYFCEQPVCMEVDIDGKMQRSIVDFWVFYKEEHSEFHEVKSSLDLEGQNESACHAKKQINIQKTWCKKHQFEHKIITEKDIFVGPYRMQNLKILHSHLLHSYMCMPEDTNFISSELRRGARTIGEFLELNVISKRSLYESLARLLYSGMIEMELSNRPLDKNTEVRICGERSIIL